MLSGRSRAAARALSGQKGAAARPLLFPTLTLPPAGPQLGSSVGKGEVQSPARSGHPAARSFAERKLRQSAVRSVEEANMTLRSPARGAALLLAAAVVLAARPVAGHAFLSEPASRPLKTNWQYCPHCEQRRKGGGGGHWLGLINLKRRVDE